MKSTALTGRINLLMAVGVALLMATASGVQAQSPGPSLSKSFVPNTIGPGSVSKLVFEISNFESMTPITGLTFTDVLPTVPGNVTIADPANASTDCMNGVVTAPSGGGTISFKAGDLGAGGSCTVTVDVTASTPGVHTNPSIALTYNGLEGDPPFSQPVDLTVSTSLPGFSKSFAPSTIPLGGKSTLTFTIDNTANQSSVPNLDFVDILPSGMVIGNPAKASTTCGTTLIPPVLTATAGGGTVTLDANGIGSFPALSAGASCTVTVDVTATAGGKLDNVTEELLANFVTAGKASDTLEVTVTNLAIRKSFTDDPVPPGGTVTLEFTLNNFDRNFAATAVAFTDDLSALVPALAGLTFDSLLANDCGGSVSGVGGTTIGLTGGTVAPEGFCTIRVSLSVAAGATPGAYANTTSTVTATIDGSPVVGNTASDVLFVEPIPILTKEFLEVGTLAPDPVINAGDDVVLRFTVSNTSTTSMATSVAFLDELTDGGAGTGFLPFPVTVALPPTPDPPCGAGSSLALIFFDSDRQRLELTDGSLAAAGMEGDSCSFDVTLSIPATLGPGVYLNTTEEPTATVDGATRFGNPASDTLTVIAAPALSKAFSDDPVAPGGTVTLEFTLTYPPDASGDATAITFTDNLAPVLAGLVATGLPFTEACDSDGQGGNPGTGTLSGSAGDTLLTFMGGTLSPGESCTISVPLSVPADAAPGSYTNTTSGVGATVEGFAATSAPAEDKLKIAGLIFSKEFLDDRVIAGETTTLRFTIDNIHPTDDATITFFTDNLAAALPGLAATGPPSVDDCGGSLSGTTSLTYVGGGVLSGEKCTIEVEVLVPAGAADGTYLNVTSSLSTSQGTIDPATDVLTVDSNLLQLTKSFNDDPVAPGDSVTLEFTLTNLDAGQAASMIDFSDDLGAALSGLTFDGVLFDDCGGTVSGTGTDMITVSGVSLTAGAACTLRASLTVPAAAAASIYTNTTSAVTGEIGGFAVNGDAASDDLDVVQLLTFSKSFDGPTTATRTATLTFTLTNPGAETALEIAFTDNLDAVIPGLTATNLPVAPCGAGSSITGTGFLVFTGGELPPMGGTCSFDVDVQVPISATAGTFPNTTSELFQSGLAVADPATADLTIEPPPAFSKTFAPNPIFPGGVSTLTFTIDNTASTFAATSLDFTDNLPAGVVIATPPAASVTCTGGTLTAAAGSGVVSYTGGTVSAGASCTVTVDVTGSGVGFFVNTSGDLTSSSGNSGTASDTLQIIDVTPPEVTAVETAAGPLSTCDAVMQPVSFIEVTIADDLSPIVGADDADNYMLLAAGPDGDFSTQACGAAVGDDIPIEIVSMSLTSVDPVTVIGTPHFADLDPGLYRLLVCDTIVDGAGNQLDGDDDGNAGGDFVLSFFRADPFNLLVNGHFDCNADGWVLTSATPGEIFHSPADANNSPLSGSLEFMQLGVNTAFEAAQCAEFVSDAETQLTAVSQLTADPGVQLSLTAGCTSYASVDCIRAVARYFFDYVHLRRQRRFLAADRADRDRTAGTSVDPVFVQSGCARRRRLHLAARQRGSRGRCIDLCRRLRIRRTHRRGLPR